MTSYIYQTITSVPSQPGFAWRSDTILQTPVLIGPKTQANVCFEDVQFIANSGTGIYLYWGTVTGATFYTVQWSNNSSFSGPGVRSATVAAPATTYQLRFLADIRLGEEIFWRVAAFNTTGGVSSLSETRSLVYDCTDITANPKQNNPGSPPDVGTDTVYCTKYNVKITVDGSSNVQCCDSNMYYLNIDYNCESSVGSPVTRGTIVWSIEQSGVGGHTIDSSTDQYAVVKSAAKASEVFTLKATVTFTVAGVDFQCTGSKKVFVDCKSINKKTGQQLCYYPFPGIINYTDPAYVGTKISSDAQLLPFNTYGANHKVLPFKTFSYIAAGPVIQVAATLSDVCPPNPYSPYPCQDGNNNKIKIGKATAVVNEARVHVPFGCGLRYTPTYGITFDATNAASKGLNAYGIGDYKCQLYVDTCGDSLAFNSDEELYVNPKGFLSAVFPLRWDVLSASPAGCGDDYEINLNIGCGLYTRTFDNSLSIKVTDLLGHALGNARDGCKINVLYGCGLWIPSLLDNELAIDRDAIVGAGLKKRIGDNCYIDVKYGCGLKIDDFGVLQVNIDDLMGGGLYKVPESTCKMYVDLHASFGCGLYIRPSDGKVCIYRDDIIGKGLKAGSHTCDIDVKYACGLTLDGSDVLKVKSSDLAGKGLKLGTSCYLDVKYGCGIKLDGFNAIQIKREDLVGTSNGLDVGGGMCDIKVKPSCGINVDSNGVSIKRVDLIAGSSSGLTTDATNTCAIKVNAGCGIIIESNKVKVNISDLIGLGLQAGGGTCDIDIKPSCGIFVDGTGVNVNVGDFAGGGLTAISACELEVNPGCGLKLAGGDVEVDFGIFGNGLTYSGCSVTVKNDCGITIGANGVKVNNGDLAGDGLEAVLPGCALKVKADCGISVSSTGVSVNNADLAGDGLVASVTGCALDVKTKSVDVVTDVVCNGDGTITVTKTSVCVVDTTC